MADDAREWAPAHATEAGAAVLVAQMDARHTLTPLHAETRVRQEIALAYAQGINNPLVRLPIELQSKVETLGHHAFHLFVIRVKQRAAFQAHLKAAGIDTLIHYPIPPHLQVAYKAYSDLNLQLTEVIHQEVVSLPIWPTMHLAQVQAVIAACNAYSG